MNDAFGLIEVAGLLAAITVSDAMVKAANVNVIGIEKAKGHAWMTVKIAGDVGAVQAAIEAGTSIAKDLNLFVAQKVIPRPSSGLVEAFTNDYSAHKTTAQEKHTHKQTSSKKETVVLDEKAVEVLDEIVSKIVEPKSESVEPEPDKQKNPKKGTKKK